MSSPRSLVLPLVALLLVVAAGAGVIWSGVLDPLVRGPQAPVTPSPGRSPTPVAAVDTPTPVAASTVVTGTTRTERVTEPHRVLYAAPDGQPPPEGDGSSEKPWDLQFALSRANVQPGDHVLLRGGTYTPPEGSYTSDLQGEEDAPIVVRPSKGERVILDRAGVAPGEPALLQVTGQHTWYWGLEITNSHPKRTTDHPGSNPEDLNRGDGLRVTGPNNRFINLVVHDNADGIGFWGPATGSEIYGSLIYNNGWDGPSPPTVEKDDRAHGHGIYTQNNDPAQPKRIQDNIIFDNFEYGIKVYTQGGAKLQGYHIEGNMLAANGSFAHPEPDGRNIYIGSTRPGNPAANITLIENYAYQVSDRDGVDNVELGHVGENEDITLLDNVFEGGRTVAWLGQWNGITITGNSLVGVKTPEEGTSRMVTVRTPVPSSANPTWDGNTYHSDVERPFRVGGKGVTWPEWQVDLGYDRTGAFSNDPPAGDVVEVRPNRYESGRAHIAVFNRSGAPSVQADVSGVLNRGDPYEVRNAQDYFGAPVASGDSFDGSPIELPMGAPEIATPTGWTGAAPPATAPRFGMFVLTRRP